MAKQNEGKMTETEVSVPTIFACVEDANKQNWLQADDFDLCYGVDMGLRHVQDKTNGCYHPEVHLYDFSIDPEKNIKVETSKKVYHVGVHLAYSDCESEDSKRSGASDFYRDHRMENLGFAHSQTNCYNDSKINGDISELIDKIFTLTFMRNTRIFQGNRKYIHSLEILVTTLQSFFCNKMVSDYNHHAVFYDSEPPERGIKMIVDHDKMNQIFKYLIRLPHWYRCADPHEMTDESNRKELQYDIVDILSCVPAGYLEMMLTFHIFGIEFRTVELYLRNDGLDLLTNDGIS